MTSGRERFEFSSEKCEEIAEFRLFLRISGQKSLGRLFYQNNLPNMRQDSGNHTIRRFLPPNGGGCKVSADYVNHLHPSFLPNTSSWTLCSRFGLDKITLVKRLQCRQFSERSLIAALYFSTRFSAASFISSNLVRSLLWLKSASFTVFTRLYVLPHSLQ